MGVDEVVVMLIILSNSFINKLRRWRTNQEMWMLTKYRMRMRNNLKLTELRNQQRKAENQSTAIYTNYRSGLNRIDLKLM